MNTVKVHRSHLGSTHLMPLNPPQGSGIHTYHVSACGKHRYHEGPIQWAPNGTLDDVDCGLCRTTVYFYNASAS